MVEAITAATPIEKLTLAQLFQRQSDAAFNFGVAKTEVGFVAAEIARRYSESVKQALAQAGKTHGSTTLQLQDGLSVKADTKQTVKWDSAALQEIAKTLPWERVSAIFKIDFSVSETIYKGISALAPELRAKIDAARTTKIAEPAVSLVQAA